MNFKIISVKLSSLGLILISLLCIFNEINGQSRVCVPHESCGKCLSADESCSWCTDRMYDMRKSRCMTKKDLIEANCNEIFENNETEVELINNNPHHDFNNIGGLDAVQIQPQKIGLTLRKHQTKTIKMTYRPAKNFPLDIYCLMDMTRSMMDDKETLVSVGTDLAYTLKNLTVNYRIGFGSFVDKPAMPFMPIGKEKEINNPCALEHDVCEKTYGFRHRLSLTNDVTKFVNIVNATDISGNLDNLEGGLDALMQVLVCPDEVGWHNQSRKIVVLASDGLVHFAGDGLLAGIVKRNDKLCHLSKDGEYMASLELDYPSLEEIYRELLKRKINIIFAVTQDVQQLYDQIHNLLQEVSSVGVLKMDSSNILQLVDNGYKDFARKVQFFDNAPSHFRITYATKCGDLFKDYRNKAKCDNIEIGKEYEFLVNITLLEYPENGQRTDLIKIEEASISSEYLELIVNIEDECPCMQSETGEIESPTCNFHGELRCGMCHCDNGWSGKTCECDLMNYGSSRELEHQCRVPMIDQRYSGGGNETKLGPVCADHGECVCGQCYCNVGFSGKYCDCYECPYYRGELCGGVDHATCDCGNCVCKPEWTGDRCDCPTSKSTCIAPNDDFECSRHGVCECGRCKCGSNYFGAFCETSSTAGNALCSYYEPCVRCLLERREGLECLRLQEKCTTKDGNEFAVQYFNDISDSPIQCMLRITAQDGQLCDHHFTYNVDENSVSNLKILNHKCSVVNAGFAFGMIMLGTFLLGCFVIMAVKVNNTIQDKREFAKFEEEQKEMTKYEFESPIYNSPVRRYEIPRCLSVDENNTSVL